MEGGEEVVGGGEGKKKKKGREERKLEGSKEGISLIEKAKGKYGRRMSVERK